MVLKKVVMLRTQKVAKIFEAEVVVPKGGG